MKTKKDELGDIKKINDAILSLVVKDITDSEFRAYLNMMSQIIKHPETPVSTASVAKQKSDNVITVLSRVRPELVRGALPKIPSDSFPHPDHLENTSMTLLEVMNLYYGMQDLGTKTDQMVHALGRKEFADQESQSRLLSAIKTNIANGREFFKTINSRSFAEYLNKVEKQVFGDIIEFTVKEP